MWERFESVRNFLEKQYQNRTFDRESGLEKSQVEADLLQYWQAHSEQPAMQLKTHLYEYLLHNSRLLVDPEDWFADHFEAESALSPFKEIMREPARFQPEDICQSTQELKDAGAFVSALDISHTSPDWEAVISYGICGLRDRATQALTSAKDREAEEFYTAVVASYEAMRRLTIRFAEVSERVGAPHITTALRNLSERSPETLQEALQLSILYDLCQEISGEPVRSQGMFDRLFIRFYRHDLEQGILTRDQAKELLKFFWTKIYAKQNPWGKNIGFGGLLAPGKDACNELTELALEVHHELNRINPKLTFRLHRDTPARFLRQAAACVQNGRTAVVFSNDEVVFESARRHGKLEDDLYRYVMIGCYEPSIMGREMCCSMSAYGNIAKPLEAVFNNGCTFEGVRIGPPCTQPADYPEFEAEYLRQLDAMLVTAMRNTEAFEANWSQVNPSPLISGTMQPCLESGRDVSNAGTNYNSSGVMCCGFGTVVDSLAAVKMLIQERRLCSVAELGETLKKNWAGCENLRLLAKKRAPKWGNDDPKADAIGVRVFNALARRINSTRNGRNGYFQLGLWSINHNFTFGKQTAATPDGRFAKEPLARNSGGSIGVEKRGIVAVMNSVCKLDLAECPNGSVLDAMLHPSAVSGPEGTAVIAKLIQGFFTSGGLAIHFNIMNAEDLKKAQMEPEKYSDLQVRVCGWNSRFITLSPEEQNAFIAQAEVRR